MTKIEKEIARRNKIWKNAKKSERQVLVAKDVLSRIKNNSFTVQQGRWFDIKYKSYQEIEYNNSVQECLLNGATCNGCAMGGLMLSAIGFRNKATLDKLSGLVGDRYLNGSGNRMDGFKLDDVFTEAQQRLIEMTFENGGGKFYFSWSSVQYYTMRSHSIEDWKNFLKNKNLPFHERQQARIQIFNIQYPDPTKRLVKIMENIIQHNGRFVI